MPSVPRGKVSGAGSHNARPTAAWGDGIKGGVAASGANPAIYRPSVHRWTCASRLTSSAIECPSYGEGVEVSMNRSMNQERAALDRAIAPVIEGLESRQLLAV